MGFILPPEQRQEKGFPSFVCEGGARLEGRGRAATSKAWVKKGARAEEEGASVAVRQQGR